MLTENAFLVLRGRRLNEKARETESESLGRPFGSKHLPWDNPSILSASSFRLGIGVLAAGPAYGEGAGAALDRVVGINAIAKIRNV
jgi:hypothetical protein